MIISRATSVFLFSILVAFALLLCASPPVLADEPPALLDRELEDLLDMTITTASKREERAFTASSSVYVITNEDIHRSGATNLPEALRLAPGLNVSRIDMNHYVVAGSVNNDYFTDKLLVLIDGRPLQSQTFSMVWWPAQMYPLEDIDRIEVIRGAGSALWGSNAMNGVINIVTKSSTATEGLEVVAAGGKKERAYDSLRWGTAIDDTLSLRGYAMGQESGDARFVRGERGPDPQDPGPQENYKKAYQTGFRTDWRGSGDKLTTFQGDWYHVSAWSEGAAFQQVGEATRHFVNDDTYAGYNLNWRQEASLNEATRYSLKAYLDSTTVRRVFFEQESLSVNVEGQIDYTPWEGSLVSLGGEVRSFGDWFKGSNAVDKISGNGFLYAFFLQNEIKGFDDRLKVTLGAKVERNNYTDWQLQPNLKTAWMEDHWTLWASAARSVRLPNTVNNNLTWINDSLIFEEKEIGDPTRYVIGRISGDGKGSPSPEEVLSFEVGGRAAPNEAVYLDVALFLNEYHDQLSLFEESNFYFEEGTNGEPDHYVYDIYYRNMYDGRSWGGTISLKLKPTHWAEFMAAYTYTRIEMTRKESVPESLKHDYAEYLKGSTPLYNVKTTARFNLPYRVEADFIGFYMEEQRILNIWSHFRLDVRLAWKPVSDMEIAFIGRNVLDERYREWISPWTMDNAWINRDYWVKLTWDI